MTVWVKRAREARRLTIAYNRRMEARTLHDFEVRPGNNAWLRAVKEVQRPYPGTQSWLLSCSDSEGGHGRWVTYGGGSDYMWAKANYVVGGWLQFKWPTFKGFYRHSRDTTRAQGFIVPEDLPEPGDVRAWLSPLAQALAGAWAITHGQRHHWAGAGCW